MKREGARVLVCAKPLKHLSKQSILLSNPPSQKPFQSAVFFLERSELVHRDWNGSRHLLASWAAHETRWTRTLRNLQRLNRKYRVYERARSLFGVSRQDNSLFCHGCRSGDW